jgi:hypothetical protein
MRAPVFLGSRHSQPVPSDRRLAASSSLHTQCMTNRRVQQKGFFKQHSLGIATIGMVGIWIWLYADADPRTHWGACFGNAIADWTGVVVAVVATKYFYEIGSVESRPDPKAQLGTRFHAFVHKHSLSLFLIGTGIGWMLLYLNIDSESKWGQVIGNILSEWTQLLGLVLLTKRLIEAKSKESRK